MIVVAQYTFEGLADKANNILPVLVNRIAETANESQKTKLKEQFQNELILTLKSKIAFKEGKMNEIKLLGQQLVMDQFEFQKFAVNLLKKSKGPQRDLLPREQSHPLVYDDRAVFNHTKKDIIDLVVALDRSKEISSQEKDKIRDRIVSFEQTLDKTLKERDWLLATQQELEAKKRDAENKLMFFLEGKQILFPKFSAYQDGNEPLSIIKTSPERLVLDRTSSLIIGLILGFFFGIVLVLLWSLKNPVRDKKEELTVILTSKDQTISLES